MIKKFNLLFLTFFKIGKIKYAPGTLASLFTCALFFLMVNFLNYSVFLVTQKVFSFRENLLDLLCLEMKYLYLYNQLDYEDEKDR